MAQRKSPLPNLQAQLVCDLLRDYVEEALPAIKNRMEARQLVEVLSAYATIARWAGHPKDATWAREQINDLGLVIGVERSGAREVGHSNGSPNTSASASPPLPIGSKGSRSRVAPPQEPS